MQPSLRSGTKQNDLPEAGGEAIFIHSDVTKNNEVSSLIARAKHACGGLDIMFANAPGREDGICADHWIWFYLSSTCFFINIKGHQNDYFQRCTIYPYFSKQSCGKLFFLKFLEFILYYII